MQNKKELEKIYSYLFVIALYIIFYALFFKFIMEIKDNSIIWIFHYITSFVLVFLYYFNIINMYGKN